jgi:hypothetical protein
MGLNQPATNTRHRFLGELPFRDVDAGANVTGKRAVLIESGHPDVNHPAILFIVSAQPILHLKRSVLIECFRVGLQTHAQVVWMDPVCPPISNL